MKNKVLLIFLLTLLSINLFGGSIEYGTYLKKSNIVSSSTVSMEVKDPFFNGFGAFPLYSYKVSLIYGRNDFADINTALWTYSVSYTVKYYNNSGVWQATSYGNLQITNNSSTPSYEAVDYFGQSSYNWPDAQLTINSVSACSACPSDIRLELTLIKNKTYSESLSTSTLSHLGYNDNTRTVYWSFQPGAEYYELEYVYIDSLDQTGAFTNPQDPFNFIEPVKVITSKQHFDFAKTYPSGTIYFRVRGVGYFPGTRSPQYGNWVYGDYGASGQAICKILKNQFEYNKNWGFENTFAEGGKVKKILGYYDGIQRERQAIANVSTDTAVIVSETKYDYEGRGVVDVLPVPVNTSSFGYNVRFNRFFNGDSIQAYDFMKDSLNGSYVRQSLALDSNYGAAKYYSYLNTFSSSINRDFIPNAEGYPYTQIVYTRDNTGRIARGNEPGKAFHITSDTSNKYFTQHFYGSPSDTELKKLFGSKVGNTLHYQKNIVIDPNGQITVHILDQEGKSIATALGGNTPKNLSSLPENTPLKLDTSSLNANNSVDRQNYISRSVNKIQNLVPGQTYTFNYDLTGVVNNTGLFSGGQQICKSCKYDIKVSIFGPDGNLVKSVNQTLNPPTITCGTPSYSVSLNSPFLSNVSFPQIGQYTIIKELTLSSGAIDTLLTSVRSSSSYPSYNSILLKYKAKIDSSLCDITCQDHCLSTVKKLHPNYTQAQIDTAVANCASINCNTVISTNEKQISKNDCESLKQQMEDQLRPGGYYNSNTSWLTTARQNTVNFHNKDNSIRTLKPTVDTLQNPDLFESQWADDLFSQHPESCHYNNCITDSLSRRFDMSISAITTWKDARISGYLNPLAMSTAQGSPISKSVPDPFFNTGGRGNGQKPAFTTLMSSYKNENTDNLDYNNNGVISGSVSMWTYCYYKGLSQSNSIPDSNTAWQRFRGLYLGAKQNYIIAATACPYQQPQDSSFVIVKKPQTLTDTASINSTGFLNEDNLCQDACNENVAIWMRMLKAKCSMTWQGTDSSFVALRLKRYCLRKCGYANAAGLLIKEDIATDADLIAVKNLVNNATYHCPLDSIAISNPCIRTKPKFTTQITRVVKANIALMNEFIRKNKNIQGTANNFNWGSYYDFSNFDVYTLYSDIFSGVFNQIRFDSSGTSFKVMGWCFNGSQCNSDTFILNTLSDKYHIGMKQIASFSNMRINSTNPSTVLIDVTTYAGQRVTITSPTMLDYVVGAAGDSAVTKMTKVYVCDSISTNNTTFTFTFNTKSLRDSCIAGQARMVTSLANIAYKDTVQKYESTFLKKHFDKCFNSPFGENFYYISKQPLQYHYTLNYYDQAGNLVQTVPPAGVDTLSSNNFLKGSIKNPNTDPNHRLKSKYKYNSLQQVVWKTSPDGGATNFYYNEKGQLRLSQSSKQKDSSNTTIGQIYSYTKYDSLGRVVEVGQISGGFSNSYDSSYMYNPTYYSTVMGWLNDPNFPNAATCSTCILNQVSQTVYGSPYPGSTIAQANLRNRISATIYMPTPNTYDIKTYYSYDSHGNVVQIAQDIPGLGSKNTVYDYDLISGVVKNVYYQQGQLDKFFHKYRYDADNRLVSVKTSSDSIIWNEDVVQKYYKHGPLARMELGEYKVQGTDYYYTLQGWLKGINIPQYQTVTSGQALNKYDPGKDGVTGATINKYVALDELQMTLGYYQGDFKGIGSNAYLAAGSPSNTVNLYTANLGLSGKKGLYNGNVAWWINDVRGFNNRTSINEDKSTRATVYQYDQLGRLTKGYGFNSYPSDATGWAARDTSTYDGFDFKSNYDANGNLISLKRTNMYGSLIDNLSYNYNYTAGKLLNNRLRNITDPAGSSGSDINTQATDNYGYDELGNIIRDDSAQIANIIWSPYGKVLKVIRKSTSSLPDLEFKYDASGSRIMKIVKSKSSPGVLTPAKAWTCTYYVRNASGEITSTYSRSYASSSNQHIYALLEAPIYASSRAGLVQKVVILKITDADTQAPAYTGSLPTTYSRTLNQKYYQLTDHLDNVRVTITDQPIGVDTDADSKANVYYVYVNTLNDFGPFGDLLTDRSSLTSSYRYAFNGKEFDSEWSSKNGASYDYGYRIYDARIGRFLSVDPLSQSYPELTPYQFASNTPIQAIDIDGLEAGYPTSAPQSYLEGWKDVIVWLDKPIDPNTGSTLKHLNGWEPTTNGEVILTLVEYGMKRGAAGGAAVGGNYIRTPVSIPKISRSVSRPVLTVKRNINTPEINLQDRAKEIHSKLSPFTQKKTTTAVAKVTDPEGKTSYLVGSSEKKLRLSQKAALNKNETAVEGEGHAEVTVINHAKQNGLKVEKVAASRPICNDCSEKINNAGAVPASPLKKP